MNNEDFIKHGCEQVLRFTQVDDWDELTEKVKVQLGFNMGVIALGLGLSKEDGFLPLAETCQQHMSVPAFRAHLIDIITAHGIAVDPAQINRPF